MLIKSVLVIFLSIYLVPCYTTITSISNSQTKNLKSAELAEVQLQDVEAFRKENKLNENGGRILRRKIAPTDLNPVNSSNRTENATTALKIATEGSGVTKLTVVKNAFQNDTKTKTIAATQRPVQIINSTKTDITSTAAPGVANVTVVDIHHVNSTNNSTSASQSAQNTTSTILKTVTVPSTKLNVSFTTTTTSSTTISTTTTTTITTPKPKKPTITYSIEDMPDIANVVPEHTSGSKLPTEPKHLPPKLSVDEPEQPIAQPSQEFDGGHFRNHRDYIIPFVSIIFAVPILMGMVIVAYRRFRDFWSTRHYRRMDFLVDGMYND